jgi:cytoskeleton protein RodZ
MAETLGEKLRLAREARGITLSEVAAQTRIAARYLEAIEEDNYKPLPGGVFNKGFIKAYAKYVGVDEQEALNDYARIVSSQSDSQDDDLSKPRRSTVMTDDRNRSSLSSLIFAVIILALMSGGIYLLVQWYRSAPAEPQPVKNNPPANSNANSNSAVANTNTQTVSTDQLKVEIKALNGQAPFVSTTVDSETKVDKAVPPTEPRVLTPQSMVRISYSRSQSANLQLTVNGKLIALPTEPLKPTDGAVVKFEINRNNVAQIVNAGQVTAESQAVPAPTPNPAGDNTNTAPTVGGVTDTPANGTPGTTPVRPTPKPVVAKTPPPTAGNTAANTGVPAKTPVTRPTVITVPPAATPKRPGE